MPYHYVESIQRELEMITLKVTSKGQVTLKQDLLKHLGVRPGQKIELKKTPHGGITVKAALKQEEIVGFIGCLAQQPTINVVMNEPAVEAGLQVLNAGGDFADGVIAYEGEFLGADRLVSFDKKAVSVLQSLGRKAELPGTNY